MFAAVKRPRRRVEHIESFVDRVRVDRANGVVSVVDAVLSAGTYNRTGIDTTSSFSRHIEIDLGAGYPLLTTKQMDGCR